jgi:hypothetical protein
MGTLWAVINWSIKLNYTTKWSFVNKIPPVRPLHDALARVRLVLSFVLNLNVFIQKFNEKCIRWFLHTVNDAQLLPAPRGNTSLIIY